MNLPQIKFNKAGLTLIFFILFCLAYFVLKTFIYKPTENNFSYTDNNFYVLDLSIPADLSFCGEKIPSNNYDIKDDLKKEFFNNTYWKANSMVLFRKAQKWFPYIEPILKQEGVPDDFKYLAVIESHLSNASSSMGASGFWQLLPGSARHYGLEVNDQVDERYHVEKATHAACKHIKDAYKVFKNWTLSAAAYNLGIGGLISALRRQKTNSYFDLLLNSETGSFVYRILAYKTLFSSPGHFGIKKKKWSYFPKMQVTVFKVDTSIISLDAFAVQLGCSKATIHAFNPWLLKDGLHNPDKKVYQVCIPKNKDADYSGYLSDLSRSVFIPQPGEPEKPGTQKQDSLPAASPTEAAAPGAQKAIYYSLPDIERLEALTRYVHIKGFPGNHLGAAGCLLSFGGLVTGSAKSPNSENNTGRFFNFLEQHLFTCPVKSALGLDCPGCGMQRAFIALLRGDVKDSIHLNASLIPFLFTVFFTIAHLFFNFRNGARLIVVFFSFTVLVMLCAFVIKLMGHI